MADDSRDSNVGGRGLFLTLRVLNSKIFAFGKPRGYVNTGEAEWHDHWIWLWKGTFVTLFGS